MRVLGFFGALLGRRDYYYLLGLLVPFVVYDLALKAYAVSSLPGERGLFGTLGLMRSDVFFDLGYALLWVGLFALARKGTARRVVVVLFHAATVFLLLVSTCAHQYFRQNGTTLDYAIIAEWIPKIEEILPILTQGVPPAAWAVLFVALLYAIFGPLLITRVAERFSSQGRPGRRYRQFAPFRIPLFLGPAVLLVLALALVSLSPVVGSDPEGKDESFARSPFVNLAWTGMEGATAEEVAPDAGAAYDVSSAANANLVEASPTGENGDDGSAGEPSLGGSRAPKRNVVLVSLESTRMQATTPYNEELATTPYLDELSEQSLLMEDAYVVVPRSSKAAVTVNCGVEPPLFLGPEFAPGGIPSQCLPSLLEEEGYGSVFFQSSSETMDQYGTIAGNVGYEDYYASEHMDKTGFMMTNYVGYEDDIMLGPSEAWLRENGDRPFLAQYLTGTGHDDYQCIPNRYGTKNFAQSALFNSYLNCMPILDNFVRKLIDQYKELGLYEDTVFVVYGDHGEGFGEHGRYLHGDVPYEEGLKIPFMIHASGWFDDGERVRGPSNQTDVVPTVLEVLGYRVADGQYPGYSLLREPPEDRTLNFSCITERKCLASIKDGEKYIYHYGDQPDEVFDLEEDPLEQRNLAGGHSEEELRRKREELLAWHAGVNAGYKRELQTYE